VIGIFLVVPELDQASAGKFVTLETKVELLVLRAGFDFAGGAKNSHLPALASKASQVLYLSLPALGQGFQLVVLIGDHNWASAAIQSAISIISELHLFPPGALCSFSIR
jgi:hypothetical protein